MSAAPAAVRAVFTGSRDWRDEAPVRAVIDALPANAVVIHGDAEGREGAEGLDKMVDRLARARGLQVRAIPARWNEHAPGWCRCTAYRRLTSPYCAMAGPRRNQGMIDEERPTEGHAFPMPSSRGTWDMVRRLRAASVPTKVYGVTTP